MQRSNSFQQFLRRRKQNPWKSSDMFAKHFPLLRKSHGSSGDWIFILLSDLFFWQSCNEKLPALSFPNWEHTVLSKLGTHYSYFNNLTLPERGGKNVCISQQHQGIVLSKPSGIHFHHPLLELSWKVSQFGQRMPWRVSAECKEQIPIPVHSTTSQQRSPACAGQIVRHSQTSSEVASQVQNVE